MLNRWFHKPIFHQEHTGVEKKASWLELFYDLIFVAAFIQLGNGLSKHSSITGYLTFAAIFTTIWITWTGFTYYMNRYNVDDFLHRTIVFLQMFTVGAMAITAPAVLEGKGHFFAGAYALAQGLVALLLFRSYIQQKNARDYALHWGSIFAIGATIWTISILIPSPANYIIWGLSVTGFLCSPFLKKSRLLGEKYPTDWHHISERYALLTIIVLGESFVKVLSTLTTNSSFLLLGQASLMLLITCSIWWIYFDDVANSHLKSKPLVYITWVYAHLPLQMAIVATGVAIKKATTFNMGISAPEKYAWLLCISLGIVFLSVAIIDAITERKHTELDDSLRVKVRFFSGILIILLAPVSSTMPSFWFLTLIGLACISQILFDMIMAPFEDSEEESFSMHDYTQAKIEGNDKVGKVKITTAVRKGTPSDLRKDLFFFLMDSNWSTVICLLTGIFFITNIFFACLYMLEPTGIAAIRPDSFIDAFFFSVQTISTIGFGVMAPESTYAHIIVTLEAAIGMILVALMTGLMFTKASRPKASIIHSKNILIIQRYGKRYLTFRIGNVRGNDIIDAKIHLNALIDDISPEGDHLRRIQSLELERSYSPFFNLSWNIFHELNEESPLQNINFKASNSPLIAFTSTVRGHDGTYSQTIYSRHTYYPEDILENKRFEDITSQLPDGRLMIDYSKFHNIK